MSRPTPQSHFHGIADHTAVVTGAGRGIGLGIADALVAQGARVAAFDRTWDAGSRSAGDRLCLTVDVEDPVSVEAAFVATEERFGPVSIVVSNAGIIATGTITDIDAATWQEVLGVNATGAFNVIRRAVPAMRSARYGRIVAISSNAAKMGGVTSAPAYGASKAAVDTMIRSLAVAEARHGITANSVAPCLIDTPMLEAAGLTEQGAAMVPVGRLGTTLDVAYAVLFLCSREASFITGEIIDVNGGFYID